MEELKKVYLYRMTHIENIPHILQHGITHIKSIDSNPNYVGIGDGSLIFKRDSYLLPNGILLGDYIPFYFGSRMPMLLVINKGYNNVKKTPSENIVYCITSVWEVLNHQLDFIYSNGHAVDALTEFFDKDTLSRIRQIVDFEAVKIRYWINEHDLDIKRRKEAEFLIAKDLPASAILGYAVFNLTASQKMIDLGIDKKTIVIKPDYYF